MFEGDLKVDDAKIDSIKAKIREIESKNGKALSIKTKFKRAGLENFYKGAYITLCGETHNNLAVLMDRSYNSERDVFMLVNERPIQAFVAHIETIFYIIAEATEVIYERMNISNDFLDIKIKQMKNYLSKNPFQS